MDSEYIWEDRGIDIEREIQARVEFKMNQLLQVIENTAKAKWHSAFNNNNRFDEVAWQTFNQVKAMFEKELKMSLPCNDMAAEKLRNLRDKAVDEIVKSLDFRGHKGYHHKERIVASIIDKLQSKSVVFVNINERGVNSFDREYKQNSVEKLPQLGTKKVVGGSVPEKPEWM